MIVRKNQEVPVRVREDHVEMTDFFGADCPTDGRVSMGYAVFPPGTVVPFAAHTGDEYSYIISGKVKCESCGKIRELGPRRGAAQEHERLGGGRHIGVDADRKGKLSLSVRKRPEALVNERFRPFLEQGMRESNSVDLFSNPCKIKGLGNF